MDLRDLRSEHTESVVGVDHGKRHEEKGEGEWIEIHGGEAPEGHMDYDQIEIEGMCFKLMIWGCMGDVI